MTTRRLLGTAATAILALSAMMGTGTAQAQTPNDGILPLPLPIPVPPIRRSETMITALSKVLKGEQSLVRDLFSVCPDGTLTRDFVYRIKAPITSWKCDEPCSNPLLNGTFEAVVHVTRREFPAPNRGCFNGEWRIINSANVQVASGSIEGTVWAGTHDVPAAANMEACESCAEPYHIEGYLEGRAYARPVAIANIPGCVGNICATLAGTGLDPNRKIAGATANAPNNVIEMRIEGLVRVPCKRVPPPNPTPGPNPTNTTKAQ